MRQWALQPKLHLPHQTAPLDPSVSRLAISADGKLLAGQGEGFSIYLWELSSEGLQLAQTFSTTAVVPVGLTFSPDSKSLLVGWVDRPVVNYDVSDPAHAHEDGHLRELLAPLAFSPDGHWLVCPAFGRHVVRRFTWPDLVPLPQLTVQGGSVDGIAVSSDNQLLAVALSGGQLNCWALTNREPQNAVVHEGHEWRSGGCFGHGKGRGHLLPLVPIRRSDSGNPPSHSGTNPSCTSAPPWWR